MQVLKIKDSSYKLFLTNEWYSIDEDIFVKKDNDGLFQMIGVYFLENYNEDSNPLFNLAIGEIDLKQIETKSIESALDVYGWTYDSTNKTVVTDVKEYDREWSGYLIAEVLLNHSNEGDLEVMTDISFEEVIKNLGNNTIDISKLANSYVNAGKEWLINEYGDYHNKTTGMDIEEDTNDEDIRNELSTQIQKIDEVNSVKWVQEDYGYVLWIEFI